MWKYPETFDVIVIGGGHAGCEAAHAAARMGARTLLLTTNLDTIGKMSCNPAIGGTAKGQIVREIDALGGIMGKIADATAIQYRMLNRSKGSAVWAPRAQSDKAAYQREMKHYLEKCPNLSILQGTAAELEVVEGSIAGVRTAEGWLIHCKALVISAGTFMRGIVHIGEQTSQGGRLGDAAVTGLSKSFQEHGFRLARLKTGTPPRLLKRTIDFAHTEEQPNEEDVRFSFDPVPEGAPSPLPKVSCYTAQTTSETKRIILDNIHRSAIYSGNIQSVGPRYCPSIEDKVVRFADKETHHVFLEPEGLNTEEIYVSGISTSLPFDVQYAFLRSIPAFANVSITRPGYAIEYDYVTSGQISTSLETHAIRGLFLAGQINGTTGYEEAAAQGLIAGINAVHYVREEAPLVLKRSEALIGVMLSDLHAHELTEPYRMFTSRAEYRLLLRQDNADLRLRHFGRASGLIDDEQWGRLEEKRMVIESEIARLHRTHTPIDGRGYPLAKLLARPELSYRDLLRDFPEKIADHGEEINRLIEQEIKYAGYIERQKGEIEKLAKIEEESIPSGFDFATVVGLRTEAKQVLVRLNPRTLGEASRISGVSPADLSVLLVALKRVKI